MSKNPALGVMLSIVLAGGATVPLRAKAAPSDAAEPGSEADRIAEAQDLHGQGRARFDTLDYEGAIDLWTRAYAKVPEQGEYREIRNELMYNIATASEKAYEVDGDAVHLRRARGLLQKYLDEFKEINEPTKAKRQEAAKVTARVKSLDEKIAKAGEGTTAPPAPTAPARQLSHEEKLRQVYRADPSLYKQFKSGRRMIIAGSITLPIGLLVLAAFAFNDVNRGVGTAVAAGVIGGGLTVTGLVLIPVGAKRFKTAKRKAEARIAASPAFDGRAVGLSLTGKF